MQNERYNIMSMGPPGVGRTSLKSIAKATNENSKISLGGFRDGQK